MNLSVAWHTGVEALLAIENEYRQLVSRSSHVTLFNEWPWIRAAAEHGVPSGREVRTVTIRRGSDLVACFPMTVGRESVFGLPVRTLRPLGYPLSDRIGLPTDPDEPQALAALCDAFLDPKGAASDETIHTELPASLGYRAHFADAGDRGLIYTRLCARAPVLDVSDPNMVKASLSKSLKVRLSRGRKKAMASGTLKFERVLPKPSELPDLLRTIAAIEDVSWKGQLGVGIFSAPERMKFFESVSRDLAAEGRLEILLLSLDDQVVSYRFGFRSGSTFLDYNFAHPVELDTLSVGRILLAEAIESASQAEIRTFDASRGSLQKPNILQDWTDEAIEHDEVWLFAKSFWGDLLRLAVVKAKPFAKRVLRRMETA